MIKKLINWLEKALTSSKTKAEERLIEGYYKKFCLELETYPHEEQIFIKDTIIRMFSGIAIGEY